MRFCRLSRSRNDYLCERFSPLTRAATVVDLTEARMSDGRDAGAAPTGSTIGFYARATTREPRRSGLRRLRKQQGEGLAAPSTNGRPHSMSPQGASGLGRPNWTSGCEPGFASQHTCRGRESGGSG